MSSNGKQTTSKPIAIYHEHPDWFRPLFTELDKRGTNYVRLDAPTHHYDAGDSKDKYSLVFNRMSPSAYHRGHGPAIAYTHSWLGHLERHGQRPDVVADMPVQLNIVEAKRAIFGRHEVRCVVAYNNDIGSRRAPYDVEASPGPARVRPRGRSCS